MLFEFVQALESDKEYLISLRKLTMLEHFDRAGQHLSEKEHFDRMCYKYELSYMVFCGKELIGAVKYESRKNETELIQLQVDPKHQCKGYGSGILQQILNNAKGKVIKLTVLKGNPAVELYKRHGFEIVGEDDYEYHMENKHQHVPK